MKTKPKSYTVRKPTQYQVPDEDWACPKCGETEDFFLDTPEIVDSTADDSLMYEDDYIVCYRCGYEATGKSYAALMQKRANMVRCPMCRGKGLVPKSKVEEGKHQ